MRRVAIEKIPKAVPHGLLNEAFVFTAVSRYGEYVKRSPDMSESRVGGFAGAEQLVDVEFLRTHTFSGEYLEGNKRAMSAFVSAFDAQRVQTRRIGGRVLTRPSSSRRIRACR